MAIFPTYLPDKIKSHAERAVYEKLYTVKDKYDIFWSRTFVGGNQYEKNEYEIDFIVADLPGKNKKCKAILCIEVKGGEINYDGAEMIWTQNENQLKKGPDTQAKDAMYELLKKYKEIGTRVAFDWLVCFPDSGKLDGRPINLPEYKIIDGDKLNYIDVTLESIINNISRKFDNKSGCNEYVYKPFRNDLTSSLKCIETLGAKFKREEEKFIQLTNIQIKSLKILRDEKNVLVSGYAGTGKTLIAKATAENMLAEGKSVLLLCYNARLKGQLKNCFNNDENIKISTFHALATSIIKQKDEKWWGENIKKKNDDFWSVEVPGHLETLINNDIEKYDSIIIDEAQDFEDFWTEMIFKLSENDGSKHLFFDPYQDIFNRANTIQDKNNFVKCILDENCRNTKNIVLKLTEIIGKDIYLHDKSPEGEKVVSKTFNSDNELKNNLCTTILYLIKNEKIKPNHILIMTNCDKNDSSIAGMIKLGKYYLSPIPRSGNMTRNSIYFSSINSFKGLEIDVLFIIDADKIPEEERIKKLYTEISRGKNKVYVYSVRD